MKWLPAANEPGETITLKLAYKWDDPRFADIDQLRRRTPFRKGNQTMLEALRLGSRMLIEMSAVNGSHLLPPAPSPPPRPAVSKGTLSKTAAGLLDTYGGDGV